MVIIYIVYGGDFMNSNTYEVVKLFVGKGNFVAEKVVEFLNNEEPGKLAEYGSYMCLVGLTGECLANYYFDDCKQDLMTVKTNLDESITLLTEEKQEKILKK